MLSNRIGKAFATEIEARSITVAEWRVLLTLSQQKQISGQEITGRWAMDKMAVNRAISALQQRGLVEKKQNSQDKRVVDLMLTQTGQALYEQLLPMANQRYHKLLAGLKKPEEKLLRDTLLKMIIHVDGLEG
jgi:DNA-binding MarR family transcriptional regulator